jgi:hypothetical protein
MRAAAGVACRATAHSSPARHSRRDPLRSPPLRAKGGGAAGGAAPSAGGSGGGGLAPGRLVAYAKDGKPALALVLEPE